MKISIIGDCHLNKSAYSSVEDSRTDIPFRSADFMDSFEFIINKNINEIKPDVIVVAGDIFDSHSPTSEISAFFNEQMIKLKKEKIPVLILVGNHDICSKHHALKPLKALEVPNVKVIDEVKIIQFKDKLFVLFPHCMDVEKGLISMKEKLKESSNKLKEYLKENEVKKDDIILFGHMPVSGATLKSYSNKNKSLNMKYKNNEEVNLNDLDDFGSKYVFLGDFHKHQKLDTKNCDAYYTGSIERTDMSERDQDKGFIVFDDGLVSFVKYPETRKMISIQGNLQEIKRQINEVVKNNFSKRPIVEIKYKGSKDDYRNFCIEFDVIKKTLKENINPIHMYDSSEVELTNNEKDVKVKIQNNDFPTGKNAILDIIKELIMEETSDEEEVEKILKEAKEYFQ